MTNAWNQGTLMPAVTADTLALQRLPALPEKETVWRGVAQVVTAQRQLEGEGFVVRRSFPSVRLALADPFVLLDHMGAVEYAPGEAKGTPWHPHGGFETVTYMIDGAFEHQDTTGGGGLITDGATQWMTAGAGIQHIEKPPERALPWCSSRTGRTGLLALGSAGRLGPATPNPQAKPTAASRQRAS